MALCPKQWVTLRVGGECLHGLAEALVIANQMKTPLTFMALIFSHMNPIARKTCFAPPTSVDFQRSWY